MWPGSCDTLWRTHICLHYRVIYPWTTWQRWAAARPQTWQPCPWTMCRWVRWTKPPCWQWSERRYRAPPPTPHHHTLCQPWWEMSRTFHLSFLSCFCPGLVLSDHHQRDWGQRVEEEIRGVPSRGHGDEVRTARCLYPSTAINCVINLSERIFLFLSLTGK